MRRVGEHRWAEWVLVQGVGWVGILMHSHASHDARAPLSDSDNNARG